jgi:hypothetical protein
LLIYPQQTTQLASLGATSKSASDGIEHWSLALRAGEIAPVFLKCVHRILLTPNLYPALNPLPNLNLPLNLTLLSSGVVAILSPMMPHGTDISTCPENSLFFWTNQPI